MTEKELACCEPSEPYDKERIQKEMLRTYEVYRDICNCQDEQRTVEKERVLTTMVRDLLNDNFEMDRNRDYDHYMINRLHTAVHMMQAIVHENKSVAKIRELIDCVVSKI